MTHWRGSRTPTQHVRFSLVLPDSAALDAATFSRSLDLSPDGKQLTYVGANGLFVQALDEPTPRRLTSETARDPRFSPDGAWVAYVSNVALRKVPVGGGTPVTIVDSAGRFGWSRKGTIVFTRSGPALADLWRVSETGGQPERFVHQLRPNDKGYGTPSFLPDGDTFLVPLETAPAGSAELAAYRFSDGKMTYLELRGNHPLYLSEHVLLYVDHESVMAASFDPRSLRVTGKATRVMQGVMTKLSSAEMAVSSNGTVAYLPAAVPRQLVEIDRTGQEYPFPLPRGFFDSPRYSPDGRLIALAVGQAASVDISIYDIASRLMNPLTQSHRARVPEWTPDGRRVAWTDIKAALGLRSTELTTTGVFWRAVDYSDSATSLLPGALGLAFAPSGSFAVGPAAAEGGRTILNALQLDSTHRLTRIMEVGGGPAAARVSPDGRWLAYMSWETGRTEVYVRPLAGPGGSYPISSGGGTEPVWSRQGGELFYQAGTQLVAATLTFGAAPRVVRRDTLPFRVARSGNATWASYDVSRDGKRFLMLKTNAGSDQPIVITGWVDEVRDILKGVKR